jgi:alcohol dehydrogenase (cytochrome c)
VPSATAAAVLALSVLSGCGGNSQERAWTLPAADLSGTRAAAETTVDAGSAGRLKPRWRFRLTARPTPSGVFASTPVAQGDTVYVQDLQSNVFALDRSDGAVRWTHTFSAPNEGPNGLAVDGGRVYGATDSDAFALDAESGRALWRRHLVNVRERFVDIAPVPWKGLVFLSTLGYAPFGRGALYGLDAVTGRVIWKFDTIEKPWRYPLEAGGGGAWYPVSVDEEGRLYAGNSNPTPWGGTPLRPNGGAFPGPARWTNSLIVLDALTGRLLWADQVTPHDVRDHDFQATPILATVDGDDLVFGAGKGGRVIAWNRETRKRVWERAVGIHRNDHGPLPRQRVVVCPGLLGGVETPMAYADKRLFVPVVDLCGWGSATTRQEYTSVDPARGTGRLVALDAATGRVLWERRLPSVDFGCATVANDAVFTSTYDGTAYGFSAESGEQLWRARLPAGSNACPAVVGDMVIFGAGIARDGWSTQLVAYGLSGAS